MITLSNANPKAVSNPFVSADVTRTVLTMKSAIGRSLHSHVSFKKYPHRCLLSAVFRRYRLPSTRHCAHRPQLCLQTNQAFPLLKAPLFLVYRRSHQAHRVLQRRTQVQPQAFLPVFQVALPILLAVPLRISLLHDLKQWYRPIMLPGNGERGILDQCFTCTVQSAYLHIQLLFVYIGMIAIRLPPLQV